MWNIRRIVSNGNYNYAVVPEHPNRTKDNYVLEHRVVMENSLGRLLTSDEVVHHIDGNKKNNLLENLEILSNSEHVREHVLDRLRVYVDFLCPCCSKTFTRAKSKSTSNKIKYGIFCSPRCRGKFSREVQLHGLSEIMKISLSKNVILEYKKRSA